MSDWDASSDDGAASKPSVKPAAAPVARRGKFDDEDVEEEVKDDWEEEDEKPVPAPYVPAPKKKGNFKSKIAEKEAEERRRAELGIGSDEELEEEEEEDPAAKRKAERDAQLKADVDNAANLLGVTKVSGATSSGADASGLGSLKSAKPNTKEEWEKHALDIFSQLVKPLSSRPGYDKHFVPALCNALGGPDAGLRDVDMRKLGNRWRELAEEKVRWDKESKKLGGRKPAAATAAKAKPKTVGTSSAKNVIDTRAYGDEALDDGDDLDFM
ncbi:translation initiation factor eIF3 subunit [Ceraceosorus guamensis]|uniref:Eukaryotic translation initiation factor 3 30 kDa subunit n=1 Tax=Ceraceosorus guamensis TaxID=1522189 RepID=A0A316W446_9BASI|nr:translation initiation factor eIF3 subunit [Ceraceosorus guamensis]PWN43888.1 translation initiation factor eIF3 subunit [Ceraceosorus guamensis]